MVEHPIVAALVDIEDPELGFGIVDLGLIRRVEVDGGLLTIVLTTTSPACPMGQQIADEVLAAARVASPDGTEVRVEIEQVPPWTPAAMSADLRAMLGWEQDDG